MIKSALRSFIYKVTKGTHTQTPLVEYIHFRYKRNINNEYIHTLCTINLSRYLTKTESHEAKLDYYKK